MESELTEDPLPAIIITGFILFLHLYYVSTELHSSPINIQEKLIPVLASLHLKMGFLVSANSFHFFGLATKNNYKDTYKLRVPPIFYVPHICANTNEGAKAVPSMALRQFHHSFSFPNQFSSLKHSPLLSALANNSPTRTEFTQL